VTFEQAQEAIRAGALYGDVFEQFPEGDPARAELPRWFNEEPGLPNLAARTPVAAPPVPAPEPTPMVPRITRQQAASAGYTGDMCSVCGGMRMTRNGSCLKCEECGSTTGCS
jgi:hypothetical protein